MSPGTVLSVEFSDGAAASLADGKSTSEADRAKATAVPSTEFVDKRDHPFG